MSIRQLKELKKLTELVLLHEEGTDSEKHILLSLGKCLRMGIDISIINEVIEPIINNMYEKEKIEDEKAEEIRLRQLGNTVKK
jgi:hypothetical protein